MGSLRERRSADITEAAIRVFGEHGYHKGRVEEIAKYAGIGKGTVYEYFHSKEDIFHCSIKYIFEIYTDGIKEAIDLEETTRGKLIALLDYNYEFINNYADMMERSFSHFENVLTQIRPYFEEVGSKIYRFIFNIIAEGIRKGELKPDLDKDVASVIILSVISNGHLKRDLKNLGSIENIKSSYIIDMVLEGLKAR